MFVVQKKTVKQYYRIESTTTRTRRYHGGKNCLFIMAARSTNSGETLFNRMNHPQEKPLLRCQWKWAHSVGKTAHSLGDWMMMSYLYLCLHFFFFNIRTSLSISMPWCIYRSQGKTRDLYATSQSLAVPVSFLIMFSHAPVFLWLIPSRLSRPDSRRLPLPALLPAGCPWSVPHRSCFLFSVYLITCEFSQQTRETFGRLGLCLTHPWSRRA